MASPPSDLGPAWIHRFCCPSPCPAWASKKNSNNIIPPESSAPEEPIHVSPYRQPGERAPAPVAVTVPARIELNDEVLHESMDVSVGKPPTPNIDHLEVARQSREMLIYLLGPANADRVDSLCQKYIPGLPPLSSEEKDSALRTFTPRILDSNPQPRLREADIAFRELEVAAVNLQGALSDAKLQSLIQSMREDFQSLRYQILMSEKGSGGGATAKEGRRLYNPRCQFI
jgi:hypothetical protein